MIDSISIIERFNEIINESIKIAEWYIYQINI